jgi:CheY-like chemotaxis protein
MVKVKPKSVLVVDDLSIFCEPICATLSMNGYAAVSASDGNAAIHKLEQSQGVFDLILLDYSMPGLDGLEFLKLLRANRAWKYIPVIMLTNMAERDMVVAALQFGVKQYLLKSSFSTEQLLAAVNTALNC